MKCRVLIVTEIIAPYRIPVFNALAARPDTDLHVLFLAENDSSLRQWRVYKDEIRFSFEVLPSFRYRLGQQNLLFNWDASRALDAAAPEVIVCGGYNYLACWRAAYWARHHAVPFLLWIESTAGDQRAARLPVEALKRHFFGLCSGFLVPGKASANYVRMFGISEDRIFVAPNAIDVNLFQTAAAHARQHAVRIRRELRLPERYFLNVGRLVAAKGVFDLLDAYVKLDASVRSQVSLLFIGDGAARGELSERARTISSGLVDVREFIQRDGLPAFYALADVLVFPTHSDTWGFVVNEALACALPVIASQVAGCTADLIEGQGTGLIVPPRDIAALAAAMQSVAENTTLRQQAAQRACSLIQRFSPEACAAGIAGAAQAVVAS